MTSSTFCGENMFLSTHKTSWYDIINAWYNEINNWSYSKGSINGGTVGHFTQIVWYRSFEVGCGMAYCPHITFKYIYVCQYCPAGNYDVAYPYEVGEPCDACENYCDDRLCSK
ncbi:cysteine-rich venom protein ENH2-like [Cheilinus undulatus]|uniref:cysteine-rich venom protein ENH2-like n=1 Tax=Cheilinus undulatus TaxID=241271 RepID=UPI001BD62863|nr:cysteine-rich venom protein ENH2-like [Cheilinus undulatus]